LLRLFYYSYYAIKSQAFFKKKFILIVLMYTVKVL